MRAAWMVERPHAAKMTLSRVLNQVMPPLLGMA
jgi:hypothetical protein